MGFTSPIVDINRTTHVRCPRCAEVGRDNTGDNLACYPDGHKYCYSCGFFERAPLEEQLNYPAEKELLSSDLGFPRDFKPLLGSSVYNLDEHRAIRWVKQYGIYDTEIILQGFGWSYEHRRLIFPIKDGDGNLLAWQGRSVTEDVKPRYLTKGQISDILHFVGRDSEIVCVTEDLLSAIKVGRIVQAMPLWGSSIPLKTIRRLSERFKYLGVWLDSDKKLEAVKTAVRASQYMPTFVISTPEDPKAYNMDAIEEIIDTESRNLLREE